MKFSQIFVIPVFCTLIALSACGFTPLHATSSDVVSPTTGAERIALSDIHITNIKDRDGQYLRNQLIDRIYTNGYPENARYRLHIQSLNENITRLGIQRDATSTRAQMRFNATMVLVDTHDNSTVLTRDLIATNSFNILDSQYTTNVSTQFARERALDEIANQVFRNLALYNKR